MRPGPGDPRCTVRFDPPLGPDETIIVGRDEVPLAFDEGGAPRSALPDNPIVVDARWRPQTLSEKEFRRLRTWSTRSVELLDHRTRAVDVPRGAVFRVDTGTLAPAWGVDSAPVEFIVNAWTGGTSAEILRVKMDPARRAEDRGWRRREASLEAFAGKRVEFELRVRAERREDDRPQLPAWGDPMLIAPGPRRSPFVVLVSLDTLRARSLSTYGREVETSPFFTTLAERGTLFSRAYSTFINTIGGHESMFTGVYNDGRYEVTKLAPTVAETLRAAGYVTAAFTENVALAPELGYQRGFSRYSENKQLPLGDAEKTFRAAARWASENARARFFLFVHTYAVHEPYDPAPPYDGLFEEEFERAGVADDQRRYEREVRELDDALADFVASLTSEIPAEDLLLIVTADHGEEFREHGGTTHKQPYEEVLQVPLLVVWKGVVPEGRVVDTPVSVADIPPTISSLLDLPTDPDVDGVSLVPLLATPRRELARDVLFATGVGRDGPPPRFVAWAGASKCITAAGPHPAECFDLSVDPGEQRPLEPRDSAFHRKLIEAAAAYGRGAQSHELPALRPGKLDSIDEERRRNLRALGYVE